MCDFVCNKRLFEEIIAIKGFRIASCMCIGRRSYGSWNCIPLKVVAIFGMTRKFKLSLDKFACIDLCGNIPSFLFSPCGKRFKYLGVIDIKQKDWIINDEYDL